MVKNHIDTVLFDFGGVIAEEGFREGLKAIARMAGLNEDIFFSQAEALIYTTGYVTGHAREDVYWESLRALTGITYDDAFMRRELLIRFIIRPEMIDMADRLRAHSLRVGILSDQTNWLDDLNERDRIFPHFDAVFNSFHLGKGKRDAGLFDDIATRLHADPASILFIDDNPGHCERARQKHYQVIHFTDIDSFCGTMATFFPAL